MTINPFASRPQQVAYTLRALAWLLRYPDAELLAALPELRSALREDVALDAGRLTELDALMARLRNGAGMKAEAEYVELFDRGRRTALHLFEHVHGDSRDRGPAMVDLAQTYERAGLLFAPGELPDYLPVVLEFASTQPPEQACDFLREIAQIVRTIFSALMEQESPYASVLAAVLDLAGEKADRVPVPAEPALDDIWAEPEAFGGCSSNGQSAPNTEQPVHIVRTARTPQRTPA